MRTPEERFRSDIASECHNQSINSILLFVHEHVRHSIFYASIVGKQFRACQVEEPPVHEPFEPRSLSVSGLQSQGRVNGDVLCDGEGCQDP